MQFPSRNRRLPVGALALLTAAAPAGVVTVARPVTAQLPARPFLVRGRITGPDHQAVPNALVTLTVAGTPADSATTDADGAYAFTTARDGGVEVRVRALGFRPVVRTVARPTAGHLAVADVRLERLVVRLTAVTVRKTRARKPTLSEGPALDPGAAGQFLGGVLGSPADLGNLAAMAASIPGVTLTPNPATGTLGFSVLGLSAAQNAVTLNGVSFGGAQIPSAAMALTRLQTASFDPSVGGFSGGLLSVTLLRGSNWQTGRAAVTLDDPALQWTDAAGAHLGQKYRNVQASIARSGPMVRDKLFYSAAFQAGLRSSALTTLASADPSALAAVGVSESTTDALYAALRDVGAPAPRTAAGTTATRSGSVLARLDILPTTTRTLNVVLNGAWSATGPGMLGPTAVPTHGGELHTTSGGVQVEHAHYVKDRFLSRTRSGVSVSRFSSDALWALPDGEVLVGSQLADGRAGLATLQFGGASGAGRDNAAWFWETTHEDTWFVGRKHQLKLAGGLRLDGYENTQRANQYGTFTFRSLDDLRAGRPASFTRTLGGWSARGDAGSAWLSAGDLLRLTDRFSMQYGVRAEANRYGIAPAYNPAVDSLFGARTDLAPQRVAVSPRVGVQWSYGRRRTKIGSFDGGSPRGTLRAGLGLFRGTLAPTLLAPALTGTGLPGGVERLICVGPAAPGPDWGAYAHDATAIPTACAAGTGSATFADARTPVTLFTPGYDAPRSWRGTLGWSTTLADRFYLSADATLSRSLAQPSVRDLNFDGAPGFALADEGGRAVFADPSRIDPASGAVDPLASRRVPRFSRVAALTSDLAAQSRQLSVRVGPSGGFFSTRSWGITYAIARVRDQTRGFDRAAWGDPRAVAWGPSDGDIRHTIGANLSWAVGDNVSVNVWGQLRSGAPFTPTVSGDVNGDGDAYNDRAFVFDPARVTDSAVARDMATLLAGAPGSVRACLERQLGRAAGRNSCRGPWTAAMNASVGIQGRALRLPYGWQLALNLTNPLAGLDQLLHGDAGLRGWGQPAVPDPTLLVVRGFAPAARRFRYDVNPSFGDARPARSGLRTPFQVSVGVTMPISPPPSHQLLEQVVEPGRRWKGAKLTAAQIKQRYANDGFLNPIPIIVAAKDSLLLTGSQLATLDLISRGYDAALDSTWTQLAADIAALPTQYDRPVLIARIRAAKEEAWDALALAAGRIGALLTPEQRALLAPEVGQVLDREAIRRMRRDDLSTYR